MAVGFRTNGAGDAVVAGANTGTVTKPSGLVAGDVVIAAFGSNSTYTAVPTTSGWTSLTDRLVSNSSCLQAWWRVVGISEPSSYTWSTTGSTFGRFVVAGYSGCAAHPISILNTKEVDSGTTMTWDALSAPSANGMIVLLGGLYGGSSVSADPAGYTTRVSTNTRVRMYDKTMAGTGTTGTASATITPAVDSVTMMIHLSATVVAPDFITDPTISGNNWNGQPLSSDPGNVLSAESLTYVWKRDGVAI